MRQLAATSRKPMSALITGCSLIGVFLLINFNVKHAESVPILNMLPGAGFLRDLSYVTLDTFNRAVDDTLGLGLTITDQVINKPNVVDVTLVEKDPDANRNVSEIIQSRGFQAEEYNVITKDGYILTIQRIINPLIKPEYRNKLKPVIMQHGLMSSSVDWVINSVNVRPEAYPVDGDKDDGDDDGDEDDDDSSTHNRVKRSQSKHGATTKENNFVLPDNNSPHDTQEHPNSLGFYLANKGYDVFLANSRGNIYGQKHTSMSSWAPKFWDFTFDEQIKYDLPDTIETVQKITGKEKVGYVGHSQGTLMMFGLLSERPEYADIVEPFVALAPVAYVDNSISPVKYFAVYTPIFEHINMWFATSNIAIRYLGPIVCGPEVVRRDICANIVFLSCGFNEEELDESRITAYLSHMPSGTSVKNIAHYGQEIISGRFAKFDLGILGNQLRYGQNKAPDYDLTKIRSKSIALFIAENDWLASPKDVARLRKDLHVQPFKVVNMTEIMPKWNHIDFVYGKHAGELVNTRVYEIFEQFN